MVFVHLHGKQDAPRTVQQQIHDQGLLSPLAMLIAKPVAMLKFPTALPSPSDWQPSAIL
jgi:hypothetical protein